MNKLNEQSPDVVIIGGGIIGCALAWELAKSDVTSRVMDRRELAREASWASAGIISPPGPRHGTRADLALASFRQYPTLISEVEAATGISVNYNKSGELDAATESTVSSVRETYDWQVAHGLQVQWLEGQAVLDREPALHPDFTSGIYCPEAGSLILSRMTTVLARAAQGRGASISENTPVSGILIEKGRATGVQTFDDVIPTGAVVIAAGAWSRTLGESIDFTIPTIPVKGQMLSIADPPIPLRSVIAAGGGYLVPRADGSVAVGATEEHGAGFDTNVTPAGIAWLTSLIERTAPSLLNGRLLDTWAGLRPSVEDGEPIIGRVPHLDNVWIATGHFRSGALLAPATAKALTAAITTREPQSLLAPFEPARLV